MFYFTLGQREGLNIGGVRGFDAAPWYVVGKDVAENVLYVDQGADSPWLHSQALWSEAAHWIAGSPPAARFACTAQTRYRQRDEECTVEVADDGTLAVRFARGQRAVTPGQSLVLYAGDVCLGGAVIARTDASIPKELHPACSRDVRGWPVIRRACPRRSMSTSFRRSSPCCRPRWKSIATGPRSRTSGARSPMPTSIA